MPFCQIPCLLHSSTVSRNIQIFFILLLISKRENFVSKNCSINYVNVSILHYAVRFGYFNDITRGLSTAKLLIIYGIPALHFGIIRPLS